MDYYCSYVPDTLSFSADSSSLMVNCLNNPKVYVFIWDILTRQLVWRTEWESTNYNNSVAMSPDGKMIAGFSETIEQNRSIPSIQLWSIESGKVVANFRVSNYPLQGLSFSGDGTWLAFGQCDGANGECRVHLWSIKP